MPMASKVHISDAGVFLDGVEVKFVTQADFYANAEEGGPFRLTLEILVDEITVEGADGIEVDTVRAADATP